VHAASTPGVGTTMTITLPIAQAGAEPGAGAASGP
jgi:hypothetical protein